MARSDGWLRFETHERLGGVRGGGARLAESSFENLTDEQARPRVPVPATRDERRRRSRRTASGSLSELDLERDPILASVVERHQDRLLTAHEGTVEVAHEALLREWPRFQEG